MSSKKELIKKFIPALLEVCDIYLADFMIKPIYAKIDALSDDKIEESIKLIKDFF